MTLLDRLLGDHQDPETGLPVHQFMAALAEYKRGAVTRAQVKAAFDLSAAEGTQLDVFLDNLDGNTIDRTRIHDVLMLGRGRKEDGTHFYTKATVKTRLGVGD